MAWIDLSEREKALDLKITAVVEAYDPPIDELNYSEALNLEDKTIEKFRTVTGAAESERPFIISRIQLRMKAYELMKKADSLADSTESLFEGLKKDDKKWENKERELGLNFTASDSGEMKANMKLYRYRKINDNTYNALRENTIWLSSPDTFNDPFDCHLRDDYVVFDEKLLKKDKSGLLNLYNKNYYDNVIYPSYLKNGIGCFSESHSEILLWSHYADCHAGICLEYDLSICSAELQSLFYKVNYTTKYPEINFSEFLESGMENTCTYLEKALCTKYRVWEYEKEWRLILPGYNNKSFQYPPHFLSAIYFGCNINESAKESILQLFTQQSEMPKIYLGKMNKYEFGLDFIRINE